MHATQQRPVIGISGGRGPSQSLAALVSQIRSVGGIPHVFDEKDYDAAQSSGMQAAVNAGLDGIDALYLIGNDDDIDPASYGQPRHPATNVETDTARRDFENTLIRGALERKMPLVGICCNMQRINVMDHEQNGGTLVQHVPDVVGNDDHLQSDRPYVPVQLVEIEAGTRLAEIAGSQAALFTPAYNQPDPNLIEENSFHHQAVGEVHKEFRVCARSPDGIVEAIEPREDGRYGDQFVLGVQWHPEFSASDIGPKLATRVVEEARSYKQQKSAPEQGEHTARLASRRSAVESPVISM